MRLKQSATQTKIPGKCGFLGTFRVFYSNGDCIKDDNFIDPCMGSGHILVYAFDVLMQIYESQGYTKKDAVQSILENNLYGLDIDERAAQLSYFAVMMKARQYDRRILSHPAQPHIYAVPQTTPLTSDQLDTYGPCKDIVKRLIDSFLDGADFGSLITPDVTLGELDTLKKQMDEMDYMADIGSFGGALYLYSALQPVWPLLDPAEMLLQKYDVVITNPPYMGATNMGEKLARYLKKYYPNSKGDLFAVFIERCNQMLKINGYQAMITQHAWMFLSSYEILRYKILENNIVNMAHLGARAFEEIGGEVVQTTSFVVRNSPFKCYKGIYSRLTEATSQEEKEDLFLSHKKIYSIEQIEFSKIPGSPIAYWVTESVFEDFKIGTNITKFIDTFQGIITGDNDKFLRLWFEPNYNTLAINYKNIDDIDLNQKYWIPYNKGGEYRRWYGNQEYVVYWKNGPDDKTRGKKSFHDFYLKEYVSWSYITSSTLATRYFPPGFLWDVHGSGIFDKSDMLYYLQSLIGSKVGMTLLNIINSTISFQVENIAQLPIIIKKKDKVDELAKENIEISKEDWDSYEQSWNFLRHPLIPETLGNNILILDIFKDWELCCQTRFEKVWENEKIINQIFIDTYKMGSMINAEVEEKDVTIRRADLQRDIKSLISYAVGCMFGRYSLDVEGLAYAGGKWDVGKYKSFEPDEDAIIPITDEEYLEDDIVSRLCDWLKVAYGSDTLEENLDFIAEALGGKGDSSREIIRNYFLKDFIIDHCKIYQKRPIYWLFDSGKQNGFKALIYLHRYIPDTIGNLRVDYLHRMQRVYESESSHMQDVIDHSNNPREVAQANKRREKLQKQLKECREYDEKISHLALSRIELNLDDGVKVNYKKLQTANDGKRYQVLAKI